MTMPSMMAIGLHALRGGAKSSMFLFVCHAFERYKVYASCSAELAPNYNRTSRTNLVTSALSMVLLE